MKILEKVRFGFIGAGQIAYSSAKAINAHPHAEVTAVQDLNAERLRELAEGHSIAKTYREATELFNDAEVDAVYIAVPNRFHAPLAIQALEAGKHVVLDKPFAMNVAEAEEVAKVVRKTGKTFMLGMNLRFSEDYQKLRSLVRDGILGEVYHAKTTWMRREGIPRLGTWFGSKEMAGAGCLYDIGVHALDLCLFVMDNFEPVSVSGVTYSKFGPRGLGEGSWGMSDRAEIPFDVDDFSSGLIRFSNGASMTLDASWAAHAQDPARMGIQLYGTDAGASAAPVRIYRRDPLREDYDVIENVHAAVDYPHKDRFTNFINHLRGEETLCVTLEQALVVQRILDAILESGHTGREVIL